MKNRFKKALSHPLISGSSIVLIGSFLANIFNYIFVLLLGGKKLLSPADFGLYMALISVFGLFATFSTTFSGIFAKFSAKYFALEDMKSFNLLTREGFKYVSIFALSILAILSLLTPSISSFLKVNDYRLVFLVILSIVVSILMSLPLGILQGEMKFYLITIVNGFTPVIKIFLGVLLIILGFKIFGVMVAVFFSVLVPFLYLIIKLFSQNSKYNIKSEFTDKSIFLKELKDYSVKFFFASFAIVFITYIDIILVRHFFDPVTSGHYAALSTMGKVIFYLTSPIYMVFFPLIARKKEKKEKLFNTLLLAVGIVLFVSVCMSLFYFLFPEIVLRIFFPAKEYSELAPLLGPFSLYILVFSMANLFSSFFLSIGKTEIYKMNLLTCGLLILLISIFHQSLLQITEILLLVSFLLLSMLFVYYNHNGRD